MLVLGTSITIMALPLVIFAMVWLFKKLFKNEVIALPDDGYLLLNPTMKPKYFFDYSAARYYMSQCEPTGIKFEVYRISNGKIIKRTQEEKYG